MRWVAIVACQRMHQTASWNPVFGSHPEWGWWNLKERSYYWQEYTLRMKITTVALLQLHNKWRKHKYPPTGASKQFIIGPGYIWGLNVFLSDQIMLRRLCNQCKWQNLVGKCATDLVAKFESYKRTRVLTAWFWSACGICQCFLTGKLKISLGALRYILLYSVPYVIRSCMTWRWWYPWRSYTLVLWKVHGGRVWDSLEATRLSGLPSGAWNVLERPDLGNGVYMESESGDVILPKSIWSKLSGLCRSRKTLSHELSEMFFRRVGITMENHNYYIVVGWMSDTPLQKLTTWSDQPNNNYNQRDNMQLHNK